MESLVNYGSDDESGDYSETLKNDHKSRRRFEEDDANYDEIGMDESSEESNNNHAEQFSNLARERRSSVDSRTFSEGDGKRQTNLRNSYHQNHQYSGSEFLGEKTRKFDIDRNGRNPFDDYDDLKEESHKRSGEDFSLTDKNQEDYNKQNEDIQRRNSSDMEIDDGKDDLDNYVNIINNDDRNTQSYAQYNQVPRDESQKEWQKQKDKKIYEYQNNFDEKKMDNNEHWRDDLRKKDERDERKMNKKDHDDKMKEIEKDRRRESEKQKDDRDKRRSPERRDYGKRSHSPDKRDRDRERERDRDRDKERDRDRDKERERERDKDKDKDKDKDRDRERDRDRDRDRERDRDRDRERERDRDRDRDRDRKNRRSTDRRSPKHSRRSSRSPDRSWKARKLEKKTAVLNKLGIEIKTDVAGNWTPRQLLGEQLKNQIQEVEAKTGVTLPTYYNPGVMNPLKYAQQIQKRKLLWGNKSNENKSTDGTSQSAGGPPAVKQWVAATFKGDNDGKMTEKFKRLMGIKDDTSAGNSTLSAAKPPETKEIIQKQEELFSNMEAQYQVARMATHTHRGVGLGFGTFQVPPR